MRNATPPTIIKMTPIVWRLKPVAVTVTANRKIAPTAISVMPAPVLITRRLPAGWICPFTGAPSLPCAGWWSSGWWSSGW